MNPTTSAPVEELPACPLCGAYVTDEQGFADNFGSGPYRYASCSECTYQADLPDHKRYLAANCSCFGESAFQASTHVDSNGAERCDLCGKRTRLALGEGEKEERQPVDFEAEGKKVNDLYWRETPAYIAMMGVVRGYVLGQASLADPLAAGASVREALEWYAEQVAGCRKIGSLGAPYQHSLDADGGKRARQALAALSAPSQVGEGFVPDGEPCTLRDCPPGVFRFNGSLGFKTEYGGKWPEPFCLGTGEYFWGGTHDIEARAWLIVQPMSLSAAPVQAGEG